MKIKRADILSRTLTGRCPNCGHFGIFKNWFRLHKSCPQCAMELEKEESGFYFGTTSIGYVLAIVLVIIPVCILVVLNMLNVWLGVSIAIIGSTLLCTLLYPIMLCWVLMLYYTVQADELPQNLSDTAHDEAR
ncbi:DUF983 domain-containing protein [Coraliomargarita sp. SDUM461004]|uniref:DUF983 domain-containing protein n=1 Tax=Thalassobacterium sedimentorum TaxID=3041258 RepID=A0ABU1AMI2_9BACT|nr:DUF983 domain-containing protein [Coraliomargarita sp. SDUM461004]MDQ8196005.1 DUF983 domain-containing protein [Coraliomargarita sp. SDUM461004]